MNHETFTVVPSLHPLSQASGEFGEAGGGEAWNHGVTRRSFLKRTGGATAATFVGWNSLSQLARADDPEPPKALVPLKATINVPEGEEWEITADPTDHPDVTLSDYTTMTSGDTLTEWNGSVGEDCTVVIRDGKMYLQGPETMEYTRSKQ